MTREEVGALHWDPIRRPAPLFFQSIFGGAGLLTAWLFPVNYWVFAGLLLAVVITSLMVRRFPPPRWRWGGAIYLLFLVYGSHTYHHVAENDLRNLNLPLPRTVELKLIPQEEPAWKPGSYGDQVGNAVCRVVAMNPGDGWRPAVGEVWVRLKGNPGERRFYGYQAIAGGYLAKPKLPEGPGQFDFAAYLKTSGIHHTFTVDLNDWKASDRFEGWYLLKWANGLRLYMVDVLQWGLDAESPWPSLMAGMLFGYRDGISAEMMNEFTITGTVHLFAVSGQNVGMILWVFLIFLRSFGLIRWRWGWLVAPGLLMFCLSTGLESSASRALVMIVLVLVGWLAYRPVTPLNLMGAAALILWIWNPWQLLDVGFQLSFLVLLGLLLFTGSLARWLYVPTRPDVFIPRERLPRWRLYIDQLSASISMLLAASAVAWLSSLPLIFYHFGLVSPITVISNCLVVPLAGLIVVLALFSVLSSVLLPAVAIGFNMLNAKVLMFMLWIISSLAEVPYGHFYLSRDQPLGEDVFKLTLLSGERHVPAILETRDRVVLIGLGTEREWKYYINPARQHLGYESFDSLIALQANQRSLGCLPEVLSVVRVNEVITAPYKSHSPAYRKWVKFQKDKETELLVIRLASSKDLLWQDSNSSAYVLSPGKEDLNWNSENAGLVIWLDLDGVNFLIAGNAGESMETRLLQQLPAKQVTIQIQGGNNREPNLSFSWLKNVRPRVIVRPQSGFYPEQDMPLEKRELIEKLPALLLELEHSGPVQIRGRDGVFRLLNWDQNTKEFTDGK
ncbi:MAG: ComEC/Rec2 family competence protein [Verrucomicrobiota bacterium]